ncbi:phospholipase C accessory protein PlcR [Burkholderia sp. FERM BP-3421]|uniref:phospholipase C accessory protein PlcR n=1 Tax=Burkholderia sp. FERM BP-3421 TaxID=1494466 RepID=UPI002362BA00|nr:phospholipase C accessory protein PlcR [Burkholderia sp. FERM BP-3421]WDD91847.1 phospholipase C accessory protein PlcR [Burkholderia sp. FERM BP-3421]
MNKPQLIWSAAAVVLACTVISGVLFSTDAPPHGAATAADALPPAARLPDRKPHVRHPAHPTRRLPRAEAYANQRDTLDAAARQTRARHLIDALQRNAEAGRIDPHGASGMADLLLDDAEPDPAQRAVRRDALRAHLRDLAMPARSASPARERQDQIYAVESRKIIDEVTASIPDRDQQRPVLEQRLGELRTRIYGRDAADTPR